LTVEVLVMCSGCGRAQPPRTACIHCGAILPESPVASPRVPEAIHPPVEGDRVELEIGGGRRVVIGPDAMELQGVARPSRFAFSSMHRVRLQERRQWALVPLLLLLAFLLGFIDSWPVRGVMLVLLSGSTWLFARWRRFVVRIERNDGQPALLELGGDRRAPLQSAGARRAFVEIGDQLKRRGVDVVH
jgi:hypothetical protein